MDFIGLCGVARSGKDTVGNILVEELGFQRIGFADGVREAYLALNPTVGIPIGWLKAFQYSFRTNDTKNWEVGPFRAYMPLNEALALFGWEKLKELDEIRRGLQRMGTEAGRDIHGPECWVEYAISKVTWGCHGVVFTDVRFDNEAWAISRLADREDTSAIWKIDRGLEAVNNHSSEAGISESLIDVVIDNRGTLEELKEKVLKAYAKF